VTSSVSHRLRTSLLALLVIGSLAIARPARAEDPVPPDAPSPPTWYGWQTLLLDVSATAVWGAALQTQTSSAQNTTLIAGLALYGLAPVVHLAHGNFRKAGLSAVLRVGFPAAGLLVGALLGAAADGRVSGTSGDDISATALFGAAGFLGGFVAAMAVDDSVVAREPRPPGPLSEVRPLFVPTTGGGGTFALAGRF
jgi:hypothetical protein